MIIATPQIRSHDFWRYINLCVCIVCICNRNFRRLKTVRPIAGVSNDFTRFVGKTSACQFTQFLINDISNVNVCERTSYGHADVTRMSPDRC